MLMRRLQASDATTLMGLLTDVVRSGVFGGYLKIDLHHKREVDKIQPVFEALCGCR